MTKKFLTSQKTRITLFGRREYMSWQEWQPSAMVATHAPSRMHRRNLALIRHRSLNTCCVATESASWMDGSRACMPCSSNQMKRVCLPNNHVFYVVWTHDFFCTIELRSNNLHPSSTSSLLLPPDNHKITYPQITRNNFFLCKDKKKREKGFMCFRLHCCAGRKLRWSASSRCGCRCQQRRRRSLGREASRSQGASRDEQQESLWFKQLKQGLV